MPIFEIEAPDGGIYQVEGPDEAGAIQFLQSQLGGGQQAPAAPSSPGWGETIMDAGKSLGSGILQGATDLVGLPGTISDAWNNSLSAITGLPQLPGSVGSGASLGEGVAAVTGGANQYQPQTTTGEYAQKVGQFLPGAAAFGGVNPSNLITYGVAPAVTSQAAGDVAGAVIGEGARPYAEVAGALAGPALVAGARRAITPIGVSPERQMTVDYLRQQGVNPTAGQITGSKGLQAREAELGGGAAYERASEEFTGAALKAAGINANRATPEALETGYRELGRKFDDLASTSSTPLTTQTQDDLLKVVTDYVDTAPEVKGVVERAMTRVGELAKNGTLTGEGYQTMRSWIGKATQNADPATKFALRDIQDVLDDAVEQALGSAQREAWREVRGQYRNFVTIERAATAAGEGAASGLISPAQLRSAVVNTQGRRNYAFGRGDLQGLSRAGTQVMAPLPNSGTALRLDARTLGGAGGLVGGTAGSYFGGVPGALAGMVAGAAAPVVAGRAIMSRPVQAYLGNNLIAPGRIDPTLYNSVVARALAASGQPQQLQGQ